MKSLSRTSITPSKRFTLNSDTSSKSCTSLPSGSRRRWRSAKVSSTKSLADNYRRLWTRALKSSLLLTRSQRRLKAKCSSGSQLLWFRSRLSTNITLRTWITCFSGWIRLWWSARLHYASASVPMPITRLSPRSANSLWSTASAIRSSCFARWILRNLPFSWAVWCPLQRSQTISSS